MTTCALQKQRKLKGEIAATIKDVKIINNPLKGSGGHHTIMLALARTFEDNHPDRYKLIYYLKALTIAFPISIVPHFD